MANIAITTTCERSCSGCFARAAFAETRPPARMSLDAFERALALLQRSRVDEVRLLGGEPTHHPDFALFAQRALDRMGKLTVFSHGLMPEPAIAWLERQPPERVSVTVNVPHSLSSELSPRLSDTLLRLGPRAMAGTSLSAKATPLVALLALIDRFAMRRTVRLGLTHPDADRSNRWLHPRHYSMVGARVESFAQEAARRGVKLALDCGFVPCMFSHRALPWLANGIGAQCGPALDILPDGRAISCFPLARIAGAIELSADDTTRSVRDSFARRLAPYQGIGVFSCCSRCRYLEVGCCTGGCVAVAVGWMGARAAVRGGESEGAGGI
jgi:hypothetical protein